MNCPAVLRACYSWPRNHWPAKLSSATRCALAVGNAFLLVHCALLAVVAADREQMFDADVGQIQAILQKEGTLPATAVKKLEGILALNPENCKVRLLLAQYYETLALPDEAAEQVAIAIKDVPNSLPELIELITSELSLRHLKSATALVAEARKRFPRNARITFLQGQIFSAQKQTDKAEQAFTRAESTAGRSGEKIVGLPTALAEVRNGQNRFSEAYSLAGIDIVNDPKFWPAYKARGVAASGLGYLDEAVRTLFVAYRHLDQSQVAGSFATAAYRSGKFDVALPPALINLAANPLPGEFSSGQKKLIIEIWRKLPAKEAETILDRTESRSSVATNADYHFAMGEVMDSLRRFDVAVAEYRRALQVRPGMEQSFYRKGLDMELYFHRYDEAAGDYVQALKLMPEDYDVQQSLKRLNNRLHSHPTDFSWQLKDLIRSPR
jgi:tetratricopeptide (TPR) repeat protein